jgi:hypothetical protein
MKIRWSAFNIYLLAAVLLAGCRTPQERMDAAQSRRQKKELTALRLHLEDSGGDPNRLQTISILRASPMQITVQKDSFLDERDIIGASLANYMGGFVIQIRFNEHGTLVLDTTSTANKGKRVAIACDFGETRWLAAPVMSRRITEGVLTFTPDATREEALRIVRGLNNTAAQIKKQEQFLPGW